MVLATTFIGALDYLGGPNDYAVGDFNNDGLLDVLLTGASWDFVLNQPSDRGNAIFALMAQGGGSFTIESRSDLGALITPIATDVAEFIFATAPILQTKLLSPRSIRTSWIVFQMKAGLMVGMTCW